MIPAIYRQRQQSAATYVAADGLGGSDGGEGLVVELAALLLEEDEGRGEAAGGSGEAGGTGGAEDVAGEHGEWWRGGQRQRQRGDGEELR